MVFDDGYWNDTVVYKCYALNISIMFEYMLAVILI